jgi:putative ABC transport system permease protein
MILPSKIDINDLLRSALADFRRNKTRTFLTALGIMIGVMSVVMLIALGVGLRNYLKDQFESLGANLIIVLPGTGFSQEGGLSSFGPGLVGGIKLDEKDYVSLTRISEVDYVAPLFFKSTPFEANGNKETGYIEASNEEVFKILNLEPLVGVAFSKSEVSGRAKVGVLGYSLAEKLFDTPEAALGKTVRFEGTRYKVIGVLKKKGDNGFVIPYKSTFGSINPDKSFFTIYLGVTSSDNIEAVKKKAEEILLRRYREDEFSVTEQSEILGTVNQVFAILNSVLIAIGSISLVVGGIGIMNIMYATVTERTKEVGVRRAVGATEQDILFQFLTESVTLSLFGGVLGLILSTVIVLIVRLFFPAAINLLSVVVTLLISSGIGIFFGVFPARRAAKLPPIEAIRYE